MPRQTWSPRSHSPKDKLVKNRPYATKGHSVGRYAGGLVWTRMLPDGRKIVITVDESGREISREIVTS